MSKQYHEAPRFRFVHPGARVVAGPLVVAGAGLAAAAVVFGPLADEQTRMLAGSAPQTQAVASPGHGAHEVRFRSVPAGRTDEMRGECPVPGPDLVLENMTRAKIA